MPQLHTLVTVYIHIGGKKLDSIGLKKIIPDITSCKQFNFWFDQSVCVITGRGGGVSTVYWKDTNVSLLTQWQGKHKKERTGGEQAS